MKTTISLEPYQAKTFFLTRGPKTQCLLLASVQPISCGFRKQKGSIAVISPPTQSKDLRLQMPNVRPHYIVSLEVFSAIFTAIVMP